VADFERGLAQAEQAKDQMAVRLALEQAVEAYRGDLLPSCYDEWILPERERLRQLFLGALERLLLLHEREGNYAAAIRAAQRLLRHDPLQEATYRYLMRLYAASGDRAAALRTYHTCVTVLERELVAEPAAATRAAYERLLQKEEPTALPAVPPPKAVAAAPLLGRHQEWERLRQAWQQARTGEPHLVVLSGEAGIGKTRLAEEFLAWVARQGSATASARCYAAEGELAYAPVTSWLRSEAIASSLSRLADPWLVEVARFVPELLLNRADLPHPSPLSERWHAPALRTSAGACPAGLTSPRAAAAR
jgi:tetratricopeptide (TPR) repeat protein